MVEYIIPTSFEDYQLLHEALNQTKHDGYEKEKWHRRLYNHLKQTKFTSIHELNSIVLKSWHQTVREEDCLRTVNSVIEYEFIQPCNQVSKFLWERRRQAKVE